MRPKVELLEYHGKVRADAQHLLGVRRAAGMASAFPLHWLALEQDLTLLAVLQKVAAP